MKIYCRYFNLEESTMSDGRNEKKTYEQLEEENFRLRRKNKNRAKALRDLNRAIAANYYRHQTSADTARGNALAINAALNMIGQYGGFDGSHHKDWVLDQTARLLIGNLQSYNKWVANLKTGDDGPETYSYSEGIAP